MTVKDSKGVGENGEEKTVDSNNEKNDGNIAETEKNRRKNRLRDQVTSLHREMEIAEYNVNAQGRSSRKRGPPHLRKARSQKRKMLEEDDANDQAIVVATGKDNKKPRRLRGSKVALNDEVIEGSMIFGKRSDITNANNNNQKNNMNESKSTSEEYNDETMLDEEDDNDDNGEDEEDDTDEAFKDEVQNENENEDFAGNEGRYEMYADEYSDPKDFLEDEMENPDEVDEINRLNHGKKGSKKNSKKSDSNAKLSSGATPNKAKNNNNKRVMFRLKNFKSSRLAEKHGIALGQFARGCHKTAISQLCQVAATAPTAPQIYSSMGLVYENLLQKKQQEATTETISKPNESNKSDNAGVLNKESEDNKAPEIISTTKSTAISSNNENHSDESENESMEGEEKEKITVDDENWNVKMSLAQKAYGSYHVAALLCKKDFTLWVRAADCAMEVADLHAMAMKTYVMSAEKLEKHRSLRKKALEDAKDDYMAADNLRPPGIAVPAKLANVQMELGFLSDALTILTDLKNNQSATLASMYNQKSNHRKKVSSSMQLRTELERSYTAWLLYADLMLRIGHECNRWNRNLEDNENYMFRRWLRKYASSFDWQERRLQALCLALEAAAGSKSCAKLLDYTRERAVQKTLRGNAHNNTLLSSKDSSWIHHPGRGAMDHQRWQVDTYEADQKAAQEKLEAERKLRRVNKESEEKKGDKTSNDKTKVNDKGVNLEKSKSNSDDEENDDDKNDSKANTGGEQNELQNQLSDTAIGNEEDGKESEKPIDEEQGKVISNDQPLKNDYHEEESPLLFLMKSILNPGDFQDEVDKQFQNDRKLMLSRHRSEISKFDTETMQMNIVPNSHAATTRSAQREKLVKQHKLAVITLVGDFHAQRAAQKNIDDNLSVDDGSTSQTGDEAVTREKNKNRMPLEPLPITGSCTAVCFIASQLMRQCLALELYHGARLVAEAVSSYLNERALKYEKRLEKAESFQNRIESSLLDGIQLNKEKYDDICNDSSDESDSDEYDDVISDDEDLENDKSGSFLNDLKMGVLPTEIKFFYALSLIGEGNSHYLASRLVHSIQFLDDNESFDLENSLQNRELASVDTGVLPDQSWVIFRDSMIEPMKRTTAFSFTADLLQKMKKENEWSFKLAGIFDEQLKLLEENGHLELLLNEEKSKENDTSLVHMTLKSQLIKIMLSCCRMNLLKAQKMMNSVNKSIAHNDSQNHTSDKEEKMNEVKAIAQSIVTLTLRYEKILWSEVDPDDGAIKSSSIEFLKILSGAFSVLMKCTVSSPEQYKKLDFKFDRQDVLSLISKLRNAMSVICQIDIPSHEEVNTIDNYFVTDALNKFPIPSEWQSNSDREISKCAFNLCVGSTVSAFSGWEKDEFELELLRKRRGPNYFGVKVRGMQVAGYLNASTELELANQWILIQKLIPSLEPLSFEDKLAGAKKAEWLAESLKKLKIQYKNEKVAVFGEEYGISLFLVFSKLCLLAADAEPDSVKKENLLKLSFSVVLPMSQFCIDETIWTSDVGTKATRHGGVSEWENYVEMRSKFEGSSDRSPPPPPPCRLKPTRKITKTQTRAAERLTLPSNSPLAKLIKVPASLLLQEWRGKEETELDNNNQGLDKWTQKCSGPALFAMQNVDYSIKKLRQCFTVNSLQKASIEVAAALLEVASQKECRNPFLCLHQAAVFASQGSKGGNNDESFKKEMSVEEECTPQEALGILGRADCLRAIHFTDEAMYLCSYVAKICCLHRDRERPELAWTTKWRVVGIQTYIISVAIDATICSLMEGDTRITALGNWEQEVREEILRSKSDAFGLTRAIARKNKKEKMNQRRKQNEPRKDEKLEEDKCKTNKEVEEEWTEEDYEEESEQWNGNEEQVEATGENPQSVIQQDENITLERKHSITKEIDATWDLGANNGVDGVMDLVPELNNADLSYLADDDYGDIPTVEV